MTRGHTSKQNMEKEVYLYKLTSEGITEMHGGLFRYGFSKMLFKGDSLVVEVSDEPGKIFRKFVWFDESNFNKAKAMFIDYEQNLIEQARHKIEICEETVNMLINLESK